MYRAGWLMNWLIDMMTSRHFITNTRIKTTPQRWRFSPQISPNQMPYRFVSWFLSPELPSNIFLVNIWWNLWHKYMENGPKKMLQNKKRYNRWLVKFSKLELVLFYVFSFRLPGEVIAVAIPTEHFDCVFKILIALPNTKEWSKSERKKKLSAKVCEICSHVVKDDKCQRYNNMSWKL